MEHDYIVSATSIPTSREKFETEAKEIVSENIFEKAWVEISGVHTEMDLNATLRRPLDNNNDNNDDNDIFSGFDDEDDEYDFDDMDPFANTTSDLPPSVKFTHTPHHNFTNEMLVYVDRIMFVSKVLFTVREMDEDELTRHATEICGSEHVSTLDHLEDLEDEITAATCSLTLIPDWVKQSDSGILKRLRHVHESAVLKEIPYRVMSRERGEEETSLILPLGIYVHIEKTFYADCDDDVHIHNKFIFDCVNEDLDRVLSESTSCAIHPTWRRSNLRPALLPTLSRFSNDDDVVSWLKQSFRNSEMKCIRVDNEDNGEGEDLKIAELVNSEIQEFMRPGGMYWVRKDYEDYEEAGLLADEILGELVDELET